MILNPHKIFYEVYWMCIQNTMSLVITIFSPSAWNSESQYYKYCKFIVCYDNWPAAGAEKR